MNVDMKKTMPLAEIEFKLFKSLIQLEQNFGLVDKKVLLNLQVSGGQDSMALLHAFSEVFELKQSNFKNKYEIVVQHFNHKQRDMESEGDAEFTRQECVKRGVSVTLVTLPEELRNKASQDNFRNWRKKEALALCTELTAKQNYDRYFIVTAHHARDHVETVLQNILRGTGPSGLTGLTLLDDTQIFLKPFWSTSYEKICQYSKERNIAFREDSSNEKDHYTRNYIRHHILPHLSHINPNYEEAFLKLSRNLKYSIPSNESENEIEINKETTTSELFVFLKGKYGSKNLSENSLQNILHEAKILLEKSSKETNKKINTKVGELTLRKKDARLFLS